MDKTDLNNNNNSNDFNDDGDGDDRIEAKFKLMLEEGPNIFADFEEPNMKVPDYFDPIKFRRGQKVFEDNIFTMMIAKLSGLLMLLAVPSIVDIIKFTKQSGTPCTAFRRYAATILHTCIWYNKSPNQDLEFFESLKNVRRKHCVASKKSHEAGIGRINQLDMALTQFGFIGFTLLCGKTLGIVLSDDDLDGLLHFWRVVAKMLGTEERFNLCNGTIDETKLLCRKLLEDVFVPHLAKRKNRQDFQEMSKAMLEGIWCINPFINNHAYQAFTYQFLISSVLKNYKNKNSYRYLEIDGPLSRAGKILLNLQIFVHTKLLQTRYWWSHLFRAFFNLTMRSSIYLTENSPYLAWWYYGKKKSQFNIYKYHFE